MLESWFYIHLSLFESPCQPSSKCYIYYCSRSLLIVGRDGMGWSVPLPVFFVVVSPLLPGSQYPSRVLSYLSDPVFILLVPTWRVTPVLFDATIPIWECLSLFYNVYPKEVNGGEADLLCNFCATPLTCKFCKLFPFFLLFSTSGIILLWGCSDHLQQPSTLGVQDHVFVFQRFLILLVHPKTFLLLIMDFFL